MSGGVGSGLVEAAAPSCFSVAAGSEAVEAALAASRRRIQDDVHHQVGAEVVPFRDFFAVLFFVSVGMALMALFATGDISLRSVQVSLGWSEQTTQWIERLYRRAKEAKMVDERG